MQRLRLRGYLLVLLAASQWATIGLFYRILVDQYGLARQTVVAYRAGLSALILIAGLLLRQPSWLRVRRRDWPFFALFGVVGVAGFYLAYIAAIAAGSVAQAAVLLYTAPFWITLWGTIREHEPLGLGKLLALGLAFIGCTLVAGITDPVHLRSNGLAILWGLGSGLGYAVYSVCSAVATRRGYRPWTVVTYSLGIGGLLLFAVAPFGDTLRILHTPSLWGWLLAVAVLPTLLAPLCFTWGLQSVPTSNASIVATLEPIIAAGLAALLLAEGLGIAQLLGGACVLAAVIILTSAGRQGKPLTKTEQATTQA